jgi:quercetin dioxygenase-like cupin family protein
MNAMKIVDISREPISKTPHNVDARKVYDTEHATAVVITLAPKEALKKHITPVDVFFYVLEGTGIVEIGDERAEVGKDHLVESPAKIPHRWINESDQTFKVLVVKVPRPTSSTRLL